MKPKRPILHSKLTPEAYWQFACQYYQTKANSDVLLDLQNRYHANVNLCLLLKYIANQQLSIEKADITLLHNTVMKFSTEFTQPLRHLRMQYKNAKQHLEHYDALRAHLLQAELTLEQQEQSVLFAALAKCSLQAKLPSCPFNTYLVELLKVSKADLDQVIAQLT